MTDKLIQTNITQGKILTYLIRNTKMMIIFKYNLTLSLICNQSLNHNIHFIYITVLYRQHKDMMNWIWYVDFKIMVKVPPFTWEEDKKCMLTSEEFWFKLAVILMKNFMKQLNFPNHQKTLSSWIYEKYIKWVY